MPPAPERRYSRTVPQSNLSNAVSVRFFFLVFLFMLYESGRLFWPFIGAVGAAVVVAVVFQPWKTALERRWPRLGKSGRALLLDLCVLFIFVIPLGLLAWAAAREAETAYPILNRKVHEASDRLRDTSITGLPLLKHLPPYAARRLDVLSTEVRQRLPQLAEKNLAPFAGFGVYAAKRLLEGLFHAAILLFTLFFLFRDGEAMYRTCEPLIPMARGDKRRLTQTVRGTIVGVVRGTLLMSLAQTAIMTTGLLIVKAEGIVLLGFITFAATFIPSVGTALVSIPVALYFLAAGEHWQGVFLLVWGTLFMGVVDHALRPFLLGGQGQMPFFWVFFAVMGGLEAFGLKGLLIGPLILALMPVLIEIYRDRYAGVPED
jgi:predicted PurR-regulated permease PerM